MDRIYRLNKFLAFFILLLSTYISMKYDYAEINFLCFIMLFSFENIYSIFRNKSLLVNNNQEIIKLIMFISLTLPVIINLIVRNFPLLFVSIFIAIIISIGLTLYKYKKKIPTITFPTITIPFINERILDASLLIALFYIPLNFFRAILPFGMHFILRRYYTNIMFNFFLIITIISMLSCQNYIGIGLMICVYLNKRKENIKSIEEEVNEIMKRDVTI